MDFFLSEDASHDMDTTPYPSEEFRIPVSSLPDNLILNFANTKMIRMGEVEKINEPWVRSQSSYYDMYNREFSDIFLVATGRSSKLVKSRVEIERKRKSMESRAKKRQKTEPENMEISSSSRDKERRRR